MFTKNDIAEYYNTTQIHYEKWWDLKNGLSLHYGIWEEGIKNFAEALTNTNRILMNLSNIQDSEKILDAGCGVGGAAIFLSNNKNVKVIGITLSEKQVKFATASAIAGRSDHNVSFHLIDYTDTPFDDGTFDVVWACESISSAPDKNDFIRESYRVLKKGGRLILSDFFLTDDHQEDKNGWIKKWCQTWSISNLETSDLFVNSLMDGGYEVKENINYTKNIYRSARRMYLAAILGGLPSEIYNILHPGVTRFAKKHYLSGYYQFKAVKENLWEYRIMLAVK
jgi:tocopherol O-methyltransferase